jgi:hypothetical protein
MPALALTPRFAISSDRLSGCTPWVARLFTLFSYGRCIAVNKRLGHLIVSTRRFWFAQDARVINFDHISHIVYRAQALPSLAPWRYLTDDDAFSSGWAFFVVALALKDDEEVQLFTIWQAPPREPDTLDRLAGDDDIGQDIGDEVAGRFVEALSKMTGVRACSE